MTDGSSLPSPQKFVDQTLLIDADDTLWQNNVYFERAIAAFISYLNHETMTPEQVRLALNEVERENTRRHGYGVASFQRALVTCFERLSPRSATPEHHAQIESFADSIIAREIELLEGVAQALPQLATRHRLILMTKGNHDEQSDKVARSGLLPYFSAVEIPAEKHPDAYRDVCARHSLDHERTWMIGNSPRSDINPALAAGLHAVYIHHPDTWILEHESLTAAPEGQQLLEIRSFNELLRWF
ncbi:MAG: HAD family hydrolase [Acidobacteria bacterium]|jgi:putative hydrolase of the HAD superfamily|nr:HAD family hydrolase [Acidobacteriota bacterium]